MPDSAGDIIIVECLFCLLNATHTSSLEVELPPGPLFMITICKREEQSKSIDYEKPDV
jgi:hypothetical protein